MGGQQSQFTEDELKEYQELTFFTQKEILHVHKRFSQLDPDAIRQNKNAKVAMRKILTLPELQVNPFRDRICKVFSSSKDGDMTFEDFLDMMSVLSESAPKNVKVEYAFRIYDFNEDDYIDEHDLKRVIVRLCGEKLSDEDTKAIIEKVLVESDLDDDKQLSFAEFEHVISKAPDFVKAVTLVMSTSSDTGLNDSVLSKFGPCRVCGASIISLHYASAGPDWRLFKPVVDGSTLTECDHCSFRLTPEIKIISFGTYLDSFNSTVFDTYLKSSVMMRQLDRLRGFGGKHPLLSLFSHSRVLLLSTYLAEHNY